MQQSLSEGSDDWRGLAKPMFPRPVLAVSLRGQGRSDAPKQGNSLSDHVNDILAFVGHCGFEETGAPPNYPLILNRSWARGFKCLRYMAPDVPRKSERGEREKDHCDRAVHQVADLATSQYDGLPKRQLKTWP